MIEALLVGAVVLALMGQYGYAITLSITAAALALAS